MNSPAARGTIGQTTAASASAEWTRLRRPRTVFSSAPQPISGLVAAVLEPALIVAALLLACVALHQPIDRPVLVLAVLAATLAFPGRNRLRDAPVAAAASILTAWVALLIILSLLGYATGTLSLFRTDVLIAWALATPVLQGLGLAGSRAWLHAQARNPARRRRAIIVGAGPLGGRVARSLSDHHEFGTDLVGYFDDRSDERLPGQHLHQMLGGLKDVAQYVRTHSVSDVFVTLPLTSQARIVSLLQELQDTTASMYFVPDVFGVNMIRGNLRDVSGVPVVALRENPVGQFNAFAKRVFDVAFAGAGLLLAAPLMAMIALGVRLSSPGPVIQRLRRFGHNGREVVLYRFRVSSLPVRSEEDSARFPRLTPFGTFLRRHGLDALPQIVNVLQGRLSVVGPRPQTVSASELHRKLIPGFMARHMVKPGMTDLARARGESDSDDLESASRRIACDLEYLRKWSIGLDLEIIGRTIQRSFTHPTAD